MTKRIAIFCDGTWNRADAPEPTNVVHLARAVCRTCSDASKTKQLVFYLEGVGSGRGAGRIGKAADRLLGGMFGWGLLENIKEAYRALIFNYEKGDEVYIFGFSRGAYTARSLAGLIRKAGLLPPEDVHLIDEALTLYRRGGDLNRPDRPHIQQARRALSPEVATSETDLAMRQGQGHLLKLRYLGIWDTVGALGVPSMFGRLAKPWNKKYEFHDTELSSSVAHARHAVSIDELRATFPPALWGNLDGPDGLNARFPPQPGQPPNYEQMWFAGDHGSVGGGGDFHGLSRITLKWIAKGAQRAGLELEPGILGFEPDSTDLCEAAINRYRLSPASRLLRLVKRHRSQLQNPDHVRDEVVQRLVLLPSYRPKTLRPVIGGLADRMRDITLPPGPG